MHNIGNALAHHIPRDSVLREASVTERGSVLYLRPLWQNSET